MSCPAIVYCCAEVKDVPRIERFMQATRKESPFLDRRLPVSPKDFVLAPYCVLAIGDDEVVGIGSLYPGELVQTEHTAILGVCVRRFAWGRGIGKSLVEECIHNAPSVVQLFYAHVYSPNTRARKLMSACRFVLEATLKDRIMVAPYVCVDLLVYTRERHRHD